MYGLAAIQQADGFAMAGAGACIVLSGLAVLSFLISMLPRIAALLEFKPPAPQEVLPPASPPETVVPDKLPNDINAAAAVYITFCAVLGAEFSLVDLHQHAKSVGLPHPHLSVNRFRDSGLLVQTGEDRFSWQPVRQ